MIASSDQEYERGTMNDKTTSEGTIVAIPGSVTDLAKGLRELIACLRDVAALIGDSGKAVGGTFRNRRSRAAARNLDTLVFSPSGSRQYLERIADGYGTKNDVAGIAAALAATADEVEQSMRELSGYRDTLRESCGMESANALDEIIYGKFGKDGLRRSLARIVAISNEQEAIPADAVQIAIGALETIEGLNRRIAALHDQLLTRLKG